jgi:hypothetical protein
MVQEDFERLHKFLVETEGLSEISDDIARVGRGGVAGAGAQAAAKGAAVRLTLLLAADEGRAADDCSPNCCRPKAD